MWLLAAAIVALTCNCSCACRVYHATKRFTISVSKQVSMRPAGAAAQGCYLLQQCPCGKYICCLKMIPQAVRLGIPTMAVATCRLLRTSHTIKSITSHTIKSINSHTIKSITVNSGQQVLDRPLQRGKVLSKPTGARQAPYCILPEQPVNKS